MPYEIVLTEDPTKKTLVESVPGFSFNSFFREHGIESGYKEMISKSITVYELYVDNKGQVARRIVRKEFFMIPSKPMTESEYNIEMEEVLSVVPKHFRSYVSGLAYDQLHSGGYQDVVSAAKEIIEGLVPAINAYIYDIYKTKPYIK